MKLGISQYAASGDGKNFVEAASRLGLEGVEPYIGDANSEFLSQSQEQTLRLRTHAARLGVEIPSVCLGAFNGDASIITPSELDRAVELITRSLQFSAAAGAKLMLLCTFVASHPDTDAKREALLSAVLATEPVARKLGIRIALETPLAAEVIANLVDRAASDHVGVYYDYGNALAMGLDPSREIPALGKRIMAIHAKDSARMKLGGLHFGEGDVDLAAAVRATRAIGYDGWLVLETPGGDEALLRKDIALLRHCLQQR